MSIANLIVVPSGITTTQFVDKSGNTYTATNNIIASVLPVDIASLLNLGLR